MQAYEYKVVPAPSHGDKPRAAKAAAQAAPPKTGAERFAQALTQMMNKLSRDGWEYWRAETLPAEERSGLATKTLVTHHLLVFRRALPAVAAAGAETMPQAASQAASQAGSQAGQGVDRGGALPTFLRSGAGAADRRSALSAFAPEGRAPRLGPAADEGL